MLFYGDLIDVGYTFIVYFSQIIGDVAQLARALDWQSRGRGFEPHLLHEENYRNVVLFFALYLHPYLHPMSFFYTFGYGNSIKT